MLGLGPEGDGRSPADSGGDARVAEFLLLVDGVPVTSLRWIVPVGYHAICIFSIYSHDRQLPNRRHIDI